MSERLRIGVSSCFLPPDPARPVFAPKTLVYVEASMVEWVQRGGVLAYPVPPGDDATLDGMVDDLDGLLLHGGSDVCPRTYGEEPLRPEWEGDAPRDAYEIDLLRRFVAAGKPVLGICRGAQVINVAHGGTLWQDLAVQGATERVHRDAEAYDHNVHRVVLEEGSGLAALYPGTASATVNSVHHQAVREVGADLVVEARSADDGVVEAVRHRGPAWVLGVQWHPEYFGELAPGEAPDLLDDAPLRDAFLAAARAARAA